MTDSNSMNLVQAIRQSIFPLTNSIKDYDPLLDIVGESRFVLLGEASHGTHEFYQQRAAITQRLIQEKGFTAVAIEADWPDAYRVNRYVRGVNDDPDPEAALRGFQRFPTWMWRNLDVLEFVAWLRQYNDGLPSTATRVGFYGLDLYSMYASIEEVLAYLERIDPTAARQARSRYACFEEFEADSQAYGYVASIDLESSCRDQAIAQLLDLQRRMGEYAQIDGRVGEDEFFYAEQNARLIKNAEEYYRSMFQGRVNSWNLRDRHMAETLEQLMAHLDRHGGCTKVVVWEHNSHLGDARATEMGDRGEWNVGQLVREHYGQEAVLVGFTTYAGTVTAAHNWGDLPQLKQVRPALPDSYESLFHQVQIPQFLLNLQGDNAAISGLQERRLERAIGVIYRPKTERSSHYFYVSLPRQFDAVIHWDETQGVEPLDRMTQEESHEAPETFPSAL